jgi:hypothetical protein
MEKGRYKFVEEQKASTVFVFPKGLPKVESQMPVCKTGTYVSVADKGVLDIRAHVESSFLTKMGNPLCR